MTFLRATLCVFAVAMCSGSVHAGIMRLEPSSQFVDSSVPFSMTLFLDDDDGTIAARGGLITAGARILVEDAGQRPLVTLNDVTLLSGFDTLGVIFPPGFPFETVANVAGFQSVVFGSPVPPIDGRIPLATFQMTVTASPGTTVTFVPDTLGAPPPFIGFLLANGDILDGDFLPEDLVPGTVTINGVVPEPGSMLIWAGLLGAPILIRGRRRRRGSESNAR